MSHEIHITVLIENTSTSALTCEHGLSLLIQYAEKQILLDAGSTICHNVFYNSWYYPLYFLLL